jgi:hypothetical protein
MLSRLKIALEEVQNPPLSSSETFDKSREEQLYTWLMGGWETD